MLSLKTSLFVPCLLCGFVLLTGVIRAAGLTEFQTLAEKNHSLLQLPVYPQKVEEVRALADETIKAADAALKVIAEQDPAKLTFASTLVAYDSVNQRFNETASLLGEVAESSVDKAVRDAANDAGVKLQEWSVALDYREDVYRVLKTVAETKPALDAQEQRLVDEQMRTYRRAGLALPPAKRAEVEKLRKELAAMTTEFAVNINEARVPLDFTRQELIGMPESFFESPGVKQPDGRYRVLANVTWQAQSVGENADNADVRRQVSLARNRLAREKNVPLMHKLVVQRAKIAGLLGYATWADYQTEVRMTKTGATVMAFEENLVTGLQPKFAQEWETLRQLKAKQTGQAEAKLESWDVGYYTNKLLKESYAVDNEALRVYFPYQQTLEGMFAIYQKIFGLKFTQIAQPAVWAAGVQLYVVQDAATQKPMGAFYLDMFPREGKFNHFACFPMKSGGVLADGRYDLPVAALLCNFPTPSADKPSLMKHDDVVALFHEFGHVMHLMLARSRFAAQGGFSVPQDFVEAPSQMLENWVWDKAVLDTFARDYRDPAKKIPAEAIASLVKAQQATAGMFTRRQLAYGLLDMALHNVSPAEAEKLDVVAVTNGILARVSYAPAPDTAFIAYFGHLATGYDAGYYGYMWSNVLALDMASIFKHSAGGFLDVKTGLRLRKEVYGVGDTRDVGVSVEKFLGRPVSQQAFLEHIGIATAGK